MYRVEYKSGNDEIAFEMNRYMPGLVTAMASELKYRIHNSTNRFELCGKTFEIEKADYLMEYDDEVYSIEGGKACFIAIWEDIEDLIEDTILAYCKEGERNV